MTTIAPASSEFSPVSTTCTAQLLPRKKCKLTVEFRPLSPGQKSTTLTIIDNAANANQQVPLTGKAE